MLFFQKATVKFDFLFVSPDPFLSFSREQGFWFVAQSFSWYIIFPFGMCPAQVFVGRPPLPQPLLNLSCHPVVENLVLFFIQ